VTKGAKKGQIVPTALDRMSVGRASPRAIKASKYEFGKEKVKKR